MDPTPPATEQPDSSGWSASTYTRVASFVYSPTNTTSLLDLLNPQPGERIIDFGCGSGELTMKIVEKVGEGGSVVGIDASESMVCLFGRLLPIDS
jgi:ubiquinone/menaquinone biosynthesis C-methylase UbiE